ncbi:ATP-dependent protease ATPase subunit HslU [Alicyclobacillus shizuokensis]|uniref:ATP-dependent protease ATPase subunit HslU n=1 Tax=Alicyclobacillus shizuokensis TaxID=392014 RepID=UPI00082A2DB0|nr:ATP-dependent protease ATPase subunit HslU [Alicyclobacillus shizuokensis]MCL6626444.1 ATP-dependent protease ATPase subunit HslU [Alicyclobacillus shizuokensis]
MAYRELTPRQIVEELDRYIVGQQAAKRAVAVALRNRMRRAKLAPELQAEVTPKNILMIGPTGVGKTEIARRLSRLVGAPFIKVEATKFTEVGYVGRDVESMVRDLVETAIRMVKSEHMERVKDQAREHADERIVQALVPDPSAKRSMRNPFEMLFGANPGASGEQETLSESVRSERRRVRQQLRDGQLEDQEIEIEVEEQAAPMMGFLPGMGAEGMGNLQEMLGNLLPKRLRKRRLTVREARRVLEQEEAQKLIDMDAVTAEAVRRVENHGIIFIDEMDKIAGREQNTRDVSREGVQRDILPIVEGSTVVTKYGPVSTDHILFIAAGAFHISKPSDLIPELQGRFPIRVELTSLTADDFERILKEPQHALLKQYTALLETEGVKVRFTDEAIRRIAELAVQVNKETENIGARRLHTLVEKLLEDLSFEAPDVHLEEVVITPEYVQEKLEAIVVNRDLSQFIL